ncbi:myosuppressin-like [Anoplophora glabripennis]|uniref:myosuppressin-like n=1 Tax=Anoplophora glabripennis TaxID=217634 RepID=UPI0008746141|nr:myosuppressin-like [Anoplophora glabripennis]XP_018573134.1 myosuppressin-like [Anoplophora glabripennis]
MQTYTVFSLIFGVVTLILTSSISKASVISCPPSSFQEQSNPALRQLCYAIEQAVDEVVPQQTQFPGRLEERNTNLNAKRQDVDHVFLRFGRRFGL